MASRTNLNSGVRRGQNVRKVKRTRISEKGKEKIKKHYFYLLLLY